MVQVHVQYLMGLLHFMMPYIAKQITLLLVRYHTNNKINKYNE